MRHSTFIILFCLPGIALCGGKAQDQPAATISYPNFSSTAGLNLNGSAAAATTVDGVVLRLTPAALGQAGSAYSTTKIQLGESDKFSTFFQFRISNPTAPPADGFVFVLQPVSSSLGGGGYGLGFQGIRPAVGIEFDTFNNDEINNNHVAIDTDGQLQNHAAKAPYGVNDCSSPVGVYGCMANGDLWSVWIDYDGRRLHIAVADGSTERPPDLISYRIDIKSILCTSTAYAGFSASTGSFWENHDIVNWQFTGAYQPITGPSSSPMTIAPSALPAGFAGKSYGALMTVTGGVAPYTWSAANLPAGLSISPGGIISGTPNASGLYSNVVVTVQDSTGVTASSSYSIQVSPSLVPLYITGYSNMGSVAVGKPVASASFSASGGKPPYSWNLAGAPNGITLSASGASATVSGTPLTPGVYLFSAQVSDAQGLTTSGFGSLSVLGLATSTLPEATTFATYAGTLSAIGGTGPWSFVVSGLPSGLSVTSDGQFRGQPSKAGSFSLAVQVTDAAGLTAAGVLGLTVKPAPVLTLTGGVLTSGLVNANYSQSLTATGGGLPYRFELASGSLPGGVHLSSAGTLSGIPTTSGSFGFAARVTDTTGASVTSSFSLTVAAPPVVLTTPSPLASGMVNVDYPPQSLSASGGIAPYSFSVSPGALPDGLTLSGAGVIGGMPRTSGTLSFEVTATDSAGHTGKSTLQATIRSFSPDLILSAGSLAFALPAGATTAPLAQTIQVQSSDISKVLGWSVTTSSTWLQASATGATPGQFSVSLMPAALTLAASNTPYEATATITCTTSPCAGSTQLLKVQLTVTAMPAQLTFGANSLSFATSISSPSGATQMLTLSNTGSASLGVGSIGCAASWCTVSGVPGPIAAGSSANVAVNINPAGLRAGYYYSALSVVTSAGSATVPVTFFITSNPGIALAPSGYQVSMQVSGVISAPPSSFLVTSDSATPISWTASIVQGNFLRLPATGGTASASQPGTVNFSFDPDTVAALSAGVYYGQIRVSAQGIANSPLDFIVVLNVATASQRQTPNPSPAGLLFLTQSTSSPSPQNVTLYNSSSQAQGWQASVETFDGSGWLAVSPTTGNTMAAAPAVTSVAVNPSRLAPGIYRGAVNYAFAAIGVRSVNVTVVVQPTGTAQVTSDITDAQNAAQPRAQCAPTQIAATSTGLVSNFSSPTAWPTPLELTVVDDCGTPATSAQIVATFSNGDAPLALTLADPRNGRYSATWTPRKASSQVVINAQAKVPGFAIATVKLSGAVTPTASPTVNPGAVLNLYNPTGGAPAAPGTLLQIGGTYLAAQSATSSANPLPKTLGGTSVLIGGISAPVVSVSPGQIEVQAPFELMPGQPYQVVVSANGALTTPETLQFTPTAPGLSVASAGYVNAIHQKDGSAITEASPAKPGEAISVFLTGLGLTDVQVDSGAGGPSNPPANVLASASLTVDSTPVTTSFAGLAPGQPGVYRIDFAVPDTAANGDLPLLVTQGGATANTGLLPVQK